MLCPAFWSLGVIFWIVLFDRHVAHDVWLIFLNWLVYTPPCFINHLWTEREIVFISCHVCRFSRPEDNLMSEHYAEEWLVIKSPFSHKSVLILQGNVKHNGVIKTNKQKKTITRRLKCSWFSWSRLALAALTEDAKCGTTSIDVDEIHIIRRTRHAVTTHLRSNVDINAHEGILALPTVRSKDTFADPHAGLLLHTADVSMFRMKLKLSGFTQIRWLIFLNHSIYNRGISCPLNSLSSKTKVQLSPNWVLIARHWTKCRCKKSGMITRKTKLHAIYFPNDCTNPPRVKDWP